MPTCSVAEEPLVVTVQIYVSLLSVTMGGIPGCLDLLSWNREMSTPELPITCSIIIALTSLDRDLLFLYMYIIGL